MIYLPHWSENHLLYHNGQYTTEQVARRRESEEFLALIDIMSTRADGFEFRSAHWQMYKDAVAAATRAYFRAFDEENQPLPDEPIRTVFRDGAWHSMLRTDRGLPVYTLLV